MKKLIVFLLPLLFFSTVIKANSTKSLAAMTAATFASLWQAGDTAEEGIHPIAEGMVLAAPALAGGFIYILTGEPEWVALGTALAGTAVIYRHLPRPPAEKDSASKH